MKQPHNPTDDKPMVDNRPQIDVPTATETMNAETATGPGLSYWQLVRRRFLRNRYGVVGLIGCLLIVITAVFSGIIAPYDGETKDRTAIYSPPQMPKIFAPEGGLTRPYILGYAEEMDPNTFEITFVPDPEVRHNLALFVKGDPWTFLGLEFETRLVGTTDGGFVHLLGTDSLGRDVFSRMVEGTRVTLLMGFLVMAASCFIGTIVGVSSGYFGGVFDMLVQRIVEFVRSFPDLPLYLALVAILPRRADPITVFILFASILVLLRWADLSRELRGKVISLRSMDYVRSAVAVGASDQRIIGRHIVPNTSSHIIVWATYQLPEVILLESFLSFLGVGVQAPMVS